MTNFYQVLAILSPFIAAALSGALTYFYSNKTKRKEYLYQNRIEAFKQIFAKVSALKKHCIGKLAFYEGNEFSPFWEEGSGGLYYRTEISEITLINSIFLSQESQEVIDDLINDLGIMCNIELQASGSSESNFSSIYQTILVKCDNCLKLLYSELNLD